MNQFRLDLDATRCAQAHQDAHCGNRAYYRAEKCGYWRQPRDPAKPSVWVPAKWTKRDPPGWF